MIPDLGTYSVNVLGAYGISLVLLAGIVLLTVWRARRIKARLIETEEQRRNG